MEWEGGTKGIARVSMKDDGHYTVYIRITESAYTPYRFEKRRNYTTGEIECEVRYFDAEKGIFDEYSREEDLSDVYTADTESFEDAVQRMRDVLEKIAEQDMILEKKARREEYDWATLPDGSVEIQKKIQAQ